MSSPATTLAPRTLRLRDGHHYLLRPMSVADTEQVVHFFHTLSPETIHARYGYLIQDMTPERAHRLVAVNPTRELPLGIFSRDASGQEILCAMGRLVHASDDLSAECALVVHDAKRRLGLATRLLLWLRVAGRRRGLPRLFAQVRRENHAMLGVFQQQGARLHLAPAAEVVEIDLPLRRAARPRPDRAARFGPS